MRQFVLLWMITLSVVSCTPAKKTPSLFVKPLCIAQQSQCDFQSPFGQVNVSFNVEKIQTEQLFKIYLSGNNLPANLTVSAYLEGKEMYMGKIPLFFQYDEQAKHYVSDAMLGSCSEEKMTWVVWFTIADATTDKKTVSRFIEFTSERD
ncbi:hypothetical protein [Thalassotalea sp. G2M2-11]|uniref:hypothetical protein n=1 Tax=Thalassotalea sp. G2M2-11 TaxID=2787627 RepID=UPI0019D24B6B|nr:hypothetical protein [Thalassotalea sp. G2M2-11]